MITIEQGLYLRISEHPNGPTPFPIQSGFNIKTAYRALGIYNPSETSDAYFIFSNDRDEIWFISNRHCRSVSIRNDLLEFRIPLENLNDRIACDPIHLTQIDYLLQRCVQEVENSGLKALANCFHQFEGSGVTGVILLAESHFAFHTWPEIRLVTFDLYVCNFLQDNTEKASKLHAAMKLFWNPLISEEHIISRGKLP